jgi:hypothetical protein
MCVVTLWTVVRLPAAAPLRRNHSHTGANGWRTIVMAIFRLMTRLTSAPTSR